MLLMLNILVIITQLVQLIQILCWVSLGRWDLEYRSNNNDRDRSTFGNSNNSVAWPRLVLLSCVHSLLQSHVLLLSEETRLLAPLALKAPRNQGALGVTTVPLPCRTLHDNPENSIGSGRR